MPASPHAVPAARQPGAQTPTKKPTLDLGKQDRQFAQPGVNQKVRNWQVGGGGVPPVAQNAVAGEYAEDNKAAKLDAPRDKGGAAARGSSPEKSPTKKRNSSGIDVERKAWVRRKSKPQQELEEDLRHAGAPRKRVISDEHWLKGRSPVKSPIAGQDTTTKRVVPKRSVPNLGLGISSPRYGRDDSHQSPRAIPKKHVSTPALRDRAKLSPRQPDVAEQRGYMRRSDDYKERDHADRRSYESDQSIRSEHESPDTSAKDKSRQNRRSRRESDDIEAASIDTPTPDDSVSRVNLPTNRYPAKSPRHDDAHKLDYSQRFSQAQKQYQKDGRNPGFIPAAPAAAPQQVHGNRIEAWLTGTSELPTDISIRSRLDESHRSKQSSPKTSPRPDVNSGLSQPTPRSIRRSGGRRDLSDSAQDPNRRNDDVDFVPKSERSEVPCAVPQTSATASPRKVDQPNKDSAALNSTRQFPSTGKRLSTIASVATFVPAPQPSHSEASEQLTIVAEEAHFASSADSRGPKSAAPKKRLTRHDDLISVLSMPRNESPSLVSARSMRTHRTRLDKATMNSLLEELAADELKYQRELRTLVDGVIPVLLTSVLSRSDSAIAAGLGSKSSEDDVAVTQPIIDMGVALERLKANHKRMPQQDPDSLLSWAQGATKIYADYLKAWRIGFSDVVVNLAPAENIDKKDSEFDEGSPRTRDVNMASGDGERVDVAFLLKRPLVRLKYLARTLKGIDHLQPSADAAAMAQRYHDLVEEARSRSNEEQARLEDRAAAAIDPTRARDLKTLAPLVGVRIDAGRWVRARDYFDLHLSHSSGQRLDCKIEMFLRDDAPGTGTGGDVLVCEISDTGRWLLFPPIPQNTVSARMTDREGAIIVMIRGQQSHGGEWHELLSMQTSEESAGAEWVQMLGAVPVPPALWSTAGHAASSLLQSSFHPDTGQTNGGSKGIAQSRTPSPKEIDIPIGEPAKPSSKRWSQGRSSPKQTASDAYLAWEHSKLKRKPVPTASLPSSPVKSQTYSLPSTPRSSRAEEIEIKPSDQVRETSTSLRRTKAKRHRSSPSHSLSPRSSRLFQTARDQEQTGNDPAQRPSMDRSESTWTTSDSMTPTEREYSVWLPLSRQPSDESDTEETPVRPHQQRHAASVPSSVMPTVSRTREASEPITPGRPHQGSRRVPSELSETSGNVPASAPAKLHKRRPSDGKENRTGGSAKRSPPRTSSTPTKLKTSFFPSITPGFLKRHRRSSSPLKHEYAPSMSSRSSSADDFSEHDDNASLTSESSGDDSDHFSSVKSPGLESLRSPSVVSYKPFAKQTPPASMLSDPSNSLSPSQSASQGPYRTVPHQANQATTTVASLFAWSDVDGWESLYPQECSIVVTPGLIEAFDMSSDHSFPIKSNHDGVPSPSARGVQPLVALELTPLVPLRRGTALDISIRSPPTAISLIRTSNNVMFRSRSPEECEVLYSLINTARINNPTYIALQNARGPYSEGTWAAAMERRNNLRTSTASSSWWQPGSRRGSTYRSKGSRAPSVAATDSSIGTMNTAFSALRRFSGNSSRLFSIAKSTITSRDGGDRSTNSESLSSGVSTPLPFDARLGTPLGLANTKIRLYARETASKWRDLGGARLSILLPPSPHMSGLCKRVLVMGATQGETLLDVTLGESAFERVARTGIAVSVWEEAQGPNGEVGRVAAVGGVSSARVRVYMLQMKSERDCAYTFGLVGKFRY